MRFDQMFPENKNYPKSLFLCDEVHTAICDHGGIPIPLYQVPQFYVDTTNFLTTEKVGFYRTPLGRFEVCIILFLDSWLVGITDMDKFNDDPRRGTVVHSMEELLHWLGLWEESEQSPDSKSS